MNQGFILLLAGFFGLPAAPPNPATPDITAPIRKFIDALNAGDMKTAFTTYTKGSVTPVDEFAPHQWTGADAPQHGATDFDTYNQVVGVSDPKVTYSNPTRMEVEGNVAYVIMPTAYLYKQKGQSMQEEGEITVVLNKEAAGWKMRGWTWTGVTPHPAE